MKSGQALAFTALAAEVCHEANRAYCLAIGDLSQLPWDEAPAWQRQSALAGVAFIMNNPDSPASASHEEWMKFKLLDGWTYGEVKDPEKKTHPCMVAFEDLPIEQRAKDHIFGAIVRALVNNVRKAEQQQELNTYPGPAPKTVLVLTGLLSGTIEAIARGEGPFKGWSLVNNKQARTSEGGKAYIRMARSWSDIERFQGLQADELIEHMNPEPEIVKEGLLRSVRT